MRTKCLTNHLQQIANQMRECVDGTANLHYAICKQFTYHLLRTEICRIFVRTQRELGVPSILCSPQVCRKLIYDTPSGELFANNLVRMYVSGLKNVALLIIF